MSFFEFPHSRTYDSDLGWLIKKMKEVLSSFESLITWKDTHAAEYDNLKDSVSVLADEVARLEPGTVARNRRYVVISDSYGLGRNGAASWTTLLKSYLDADDTHYYTWSVGSMGFKQQGDGGYTVETLLKAHELDVPAHETITDVILALGANDIRATDGLASAIQSAVTYCKSTYTNASVRIGFIGIIEQRATGLQELYTQALLEYMKCGNYGASYLTGVEYIMHDHRLVQADGVHPTTQGATEIASAVCALLLGGGYNYSYTAVIPITMSAGTALAYASATGPTVTIGLKTFTTKAAISMSGRNFTDVGPISGIPVNMSGNTPWGTYTAYMGTSGYESGIWYIYNSHLYMSMPSTGSKTIPSGGVIQFSDVTTHTLIV